MKNLSVKSNFSKKLDEYLDLSWGFTVTKEKYNLLASQDTVGNDYHRIMQISSYLNAKIHISEKLRGSAALNLVSYLPENNESFFSIQPRFTLQYIPGSKDLFSIDFTRMEQFYHNICLGDIPLPTDLRMPSINGFKPSSSIHCEIGWKHIESMWRSRFSTFYKRRYDILGIRYCIEMEQEGWERFIMKGNASSYGFKFHLKNQWNKWMLEGSYTYSRSREWFREFDNNRKHYTLHDIPHMFICAISYKTGKTSSLSLGGYIKSGSLENALSDDLLSNRIITRRQRNKINYRVDVNFAGSLTSKKQFLKLSYKMGLYNIFGNPKDDELIDLYSIETRKHCLPYFTLNLKF